MFFPVSTGTAPSDTGFSGFTRSNRHPGTQKHDSCPDDDNKVASSPKKNAPGAGRILYDTRISGSYSRPTRRYHCA